MTGSCRYVRTVRRWFSVGFFNCAWSAACGKGCSLLVTQDSKGRAASAMQGITLIVSPIPFRHGLTALPLMTHDAIFSLRCLLQSLPLCFVYNRVYTYLLPRYLSFILSQSTSNKPFEVCDRNGEIKRPSIAPTFAHIQRATRSKSRVREVNYSRPRGQ